MSRVLLFNKPCGVLSQFQAEPPHRGLAEFIEVPDVYAAGRLDKDSEGLLVLTSDGLLQQRISSPRFKLEKTYWVQVEGEVSDEAMSRLRVGVDLKDGRTRPAAAQRMDTPELWTREPPIRVRKRIPTSWLWLTIREGKNRQVRRMTAAVGFPTLRLVRWSVGPWDLDGLALGDWRWASAQSLGT